LTIDVPPIHLRVAAAVNDLHDNCGSAAFVIVNRLYTSRSELRNGAACAIISESLRVTNESVSADIRDSLLHNV
jgi:hypothetical protein